MEEKYFNNGDKKYFKLDPKNTQIKNDKNSILSDIVFKFDKYNKTEVKITNFKYEIKDK